MALYEFTYLLTYCPSLVTAFSEVLQKDTKHRSAYMLHLFVTLILNQLYFKFISKLRTTTAQCYGKLHCPRGTLLFDCLREIDRNVRNETALGQPRTAPWVRELEVCGHGKCRSVNCFTYGSTSTSSFSLHTSSLQYM